MIKGIDVSEHNGQIDMKAVKDSDVQFIIMRLGYGKNRNQLDKKFYDNYLKAREQNIPIGIYLYSYATDVEDAKKEAKFVLDEIKNLQLEYPVFIDMEDADGYKYRHHVTYGTCIEICNVFCDLIEKNGYYAGIYASLDWLTNKINNKKLDRFDKWVAQWNKECQYKQPYGMWQYSSKGKISGIEGNVDLNYALKDYKEIIKNAGLNNLKILNNEAQSNTITYVIKRGDTLFKIAQQYNVKWQDIYHENIDVIGNNPNLIIAGEKIIIRRKS